MLQVIINETYAIINIKKSNFYKFISRIDLYCKYNYSLYVNLI